MQGHRIFIICGEASGDLHAANLLKELRKKLPDLTCEAWGGNRLKEEGALILKHISELSFMGFVEVLLNLPTILRNFKLCKKQVSNFKPDLLILVDFPGFNLRMAEWAKKQGIKVAYYVSPQLWAWKQGRVEKVKASVDEMYCILPFEKDFYKQLGYEAQYFGHPLLDEIKRFKETNSEIPKFDKPVLLLMPGSRMQEIKRKLPLMIQAASAFTDFQMVVACTSQIPIEFYQQFKKNYDVEFRVGQSYDLLNVAQIAYVTSGTATLETALFKVPQVVCYKSSALSIWIAKRVVKIEYISLVNLILGEKLIEELIQEDCNVNQMVQSMSKILTSEEEKQRILDGYNRLSKLLGEQGASRRIADSITETFF